MSLGLVGRKVGMTRVFTDDGTAVPVTVLDVANNRVTQIKTPETDGYAAVQVTCGQASRIARRQAAGRTPREGRRRGGAGAAEFRVGADELSKFKPGDVVGVDPFEVGQLVDVTGTTKGRGFTGVIRRHNFSSNRASHGNSRSHNTPGSISMAQDPGRVFPGKRMAGQYGNVHAHRADAAGGSRRQGARPAAGQGLGARRRRRRTSSSARRSGGKTRRRRRGRDHGPQADRRQGPARPRRSRRPTRCSGTPTTRR